MVIDIEFTKSEQKVLNWTIFVENDPIVELEKFPSRKKFFLFRKMVKSAKWYSKSNLPSS